MNKNRVQISNGDREGNGEVGSYLSKIERQLETEFKGSEAALAKLFLSIKFSGGPGDRLIYSFQTLADKLGVRFDPAVEHTLDLFSRASYAVLSYQNAKYLEIASQLGISHKRAEEIKNRVYHLETKF